MIIERDHTANGLKGKFATEPAYERHIDPTQHEVGKANTQKIERKHINLRTRIKRLVRRTICFSTFHRF